MAVAGYVTLDSKKYRLLAQDYERDLAPPKTVRNGVLGNTIVTQGPGNADMITQVALAVDYTPASGYGSLSDLQTALEAKTVSYTDNITSESVFGAGTYNITLLEMKVLHMGSSPMPSTGYVALLQWQKVLS